MPRKPTPINPQAMTVAQLAKLLSAAGERITAAQIRQDLTAGAPANPDGTIHLIHYTAWLAAQAD